MRYEKIDKLLLGAGAMKAGTTWLYAQLSKNDSFHFTPEKEIHFWFDYCAKGNVLSVENRLRNAKNAIARLSFENRPRTKYVLDWYASYLRKELDLFWYLSLFKHCPPHKIRCDFSNLTCQMDEKGWDSVRHITNDLKVLYILRDPIERLWSHVKFHHKFIGKDNVFMNWGERDFVKFLEIPHIRMNADYARVVGSMKNALNKDELKIIFFEDMVGEPRKSIFEIEKFAGAGHYDFSEEELQTKVNKTKVIEKPRVFHDAVKKVLGTEMNALVKVGIEPHPSWKITELL